MSATNVCRASLPNPNNIDFLVARVPPSGAIGYGAPPFVQFHEADEVTERANRRGAETSA